jgi:PAS domain S-box-containing protein
MANLNTTSKPLSSLWRGKKSSLADLGALLNHLTEAALILDRASSQVLSVNQAFVNLTGFSADDLLRRHLLEVIPDTREKPVEIEVEQQARLVRKSHPPIDVMVKIAPLDEDGSWLVATFCPIRPVLEQNWHNRMLDGLLQLLNIGVKDRPQEALEEAVKITCSILGLEMVGIYQAESGFPRLHLQAAYDPALVLPDSLPGTDMVRLSTPQMWYPGRKVTTELYRNGRIKGASYLATVPLGEDGAWVGLLVVGHRASQPIENLLKVLTIIGGNLSMALTHLLLVTNQQKEIAQQRLALDLQNVLIENVHEGVIVVGTDLAISEINPVAEEMLGYTEGEVIHQPIENVMVGCERLGPALQAALQGVPTHNLGQTQLHRRDGQAFPAVIQTFPVERENQVQTVLILVTDISDDEKTRIHTQQLEQRAVVGEVINAFAHEVRNPINNITLGVTALASEFDADDQKLEACQRIQNDCTRLNHLMESILTSSRPMEAHFEPVDLPKLLRKLIDRWRPRLAKVNVKQFSEFAADTPLIRGDTRSLEQVFINLISNAAEVMEKRGGGTLSIKTAPVNQIRNLPQVEISVTDDGPGIPDDIRDHIFEPFVSNKPRGTGLGLAITKQIVTAHHGSIKVSTFPGGTVFSVILPAFIDGEQ